MGGRYPRRSALFWRQKIEIWWRDVQWVILGIAWLLALYAGYTGFTSYASSNNEEFSELDILYRTMQLVTLESGALTPPIPPALQLARWLLPALTLYTAAKAIYSIFHEQLQRTRLWTIRDHVVICGAGSQGLLLAKGFRQQGDPVVVIELDEENQHLEQLRAEGAIVLTGDATGSAVLKSAAVHRARVLISVCGNDAVNAEVAVRAREVSKERTSGALNCIIHIVEPNLCELLRDREIGSDWSTNFRLGLFNIFDQGARLLLQEIPILEQADKEKDSIPHLLIIGMGKLGESLAVYAARQWRSVPFAKERRLLLTVIDREARTRSESMKIRYPKLSKVCDLRIFEMDVCSPAFQRAEFLTSSTGGCSFDAIYICLDDDSLGLHTGLTLLQQLREHKTPIFVRMAEEGGLAKLLSTGESDSPRTGGLRAFGLLDRTCTPGLVVRGTHEVLARAVHEEYVRQQKELGETAETNRHLVSWDDLPEEKKESNRQQIDHVYVKLQEVNCGIAPLTDWDADSFQFTELEIEHMAQLEHIRWYNEQLANGWTFAEGPKNPKHRTHPMLVPYEELPESEKEKDRNPVRKLPVFLAQAGFQIYRKKP